MSAGGSRTASGALRRTRDFDVFLRERRRGQTRRVLISRNVSPFRVLHTVTPIPSIPPLPTGAKPLGVVSYAGNLEATSVVLVVSQASVLPLR